MGFLPSVARSFEHVSGSTSALPPIGGIWSNNVLINQLAEQVLHWRVGPDRFLTGQRSWIPRWRFNPLQRLEDAFLLLDSLKSSTYVISKSGDKFQVEVEHDGKVGRAAGTSKARVISLAVARCNGLKV
jgi:hypothetical protein